MEKGLQKEKERERENGGIQKEGTAISCWEEKKKGGSFKCGTDTLVKFFFSFRPRAKEPEDTRGIQATLRPLREKKAKANNRYDLLYTFRNQWTQPAVASDACEKSARV